MSDTRPTHLEPVQTTDAPAAIGPYSQAVRCGPWLFTSGQIPLDPATGELVNGDFEAQVEQAITNLAAVIRAAGGTFDQVVKLTLFLTDLTHFPVANTVMQRHFSSPYPARSTVGVAALPKGAQFEIEAVVSLA